jgi:pimeloyl-ACP methyl ester carboxylesterase
MAGIYWTATRQKKIEAWYRRRLSQCPVPLEQQHVGTRFGHTFVVSCGDARCDPVLLLHGGMVNSGMWLRSLPQWATQFRVHSIDIIGDPGFSAPARPGFGVEVHAGWLDDVCTGLGIDQASIIGASLGGYLAMDYAIRRQSRVVALVLIAPSGITRLRWSAAWKQVGLALLGPWGRHRARLIAFGVQEHELDEDSRDFLGWVDLVQTGARARMGLPGMIPDSELAQLRCPTLVMLGGRDVFFDSEAGRRRLESLVPQARIAWYADAGHAVIDPTQLVSSELPHLIRSAHTSSPVPRH